MAVKRESCRRNRRAPSTIACDRSAPVRARWESCEPRPASRSSFEAGRRRAGAPGADDDGDRRNGHGVDHILIEPLPYRDPTVECTRRTPYLLRSTLQRVQAESLLVAQSSESEALFQLGALQTTAATPAASKAAARTRSRRRDLRTPYLTKHQPKSRMRENRTSVFVR